MTAQELRLRRSLLHRVHDVKRLEEGEDLNDALLDFFVKLGQAVIPCGGLEGGFPSVAFLGSLFYDVLRKGGAPDGRLGHKNVANWARRRLGQGGLFFDGIGALAVPVNENLADTQGKNAVKERHWWLALVLNPRGGAKPFATEDVSVICLDSLARAEARYAPPVRASKRAAPAYQLEVMSLYRQGFGAYLRIRAWGDGSVGPLPDPRKSQLVAGGRFFTRPALNMTVDQRGSYGCSGRMEGTLEFSLDGASRVTGEYTLDFGDESGSYTPSPKLSVTREASNFQKSVAQYLGGYIGKEWEAANARESAAKANGNDGALDLDTEPAESTTSVVEPYDDTRVNASLRLPDVPQQETSNDCGYFILEQILRALQLTPDGFRALAKASTDMITTLPWPSQKDVTRRKGKLREACKELFAAADEMGTDDVEVLLKGSAALRHRVQEAMWDGPRFAEAVRMLAALSAPREEFTMMDLENKPTKDLRALCSARGVLPNGMVERSDLVAALAPFSIRLVDQVAPSPTLSTPVPKVFTAADLDTMSVKVLRGLCSRRNILPPGSVERSDLVKVLMPFASPPEANATAEPAKAANAEAAKGKRPAPTPATNGSASGGGPETKKARTEANAPQTQHLGSLRFTQQDLQSMPLKTLKGLCVQYKSVPANAIERADFIRALVRFATDAPPEAKLSAPGPAATEAPKPPPQPKKPETIAERKERWVKAANNGQHLAGLVFDEQDLQVIPLKTLKALCMQHKVLPARALERFDFVSALTPLIGVPAPGGASQTQPQPQRHEANGPRVERKRDFSKFLGEFKPSFTAADLGVMPDSTLRTLCIKHGVMPAGEPDRTDLLGALLRLAVSSSRPEGVVSW